MFEVQFHFFFFSGISHSNVPKTKQMNRAVMKIACPLLSIIAFKYSPKKVKKSLREEGISVL